MPARKTTRHGVRGYLYEGRFWTRRAWRAKWATNNFARPPRRRRRGRRRH